ncbi:MAG: histidine kinase dimerization/phospho-acceptor domain-containing protein, partial [Candidatus Bathyarchaeia archaeon]
LEISSIPIMKEKERIGSLVIFHDITREKMVERMKTEFVSISAHQLRTPLSAIKGYLSMVLEGTYGGVSEKLKKVLENVYISNERMIKLVNAFLDVSRIELGREECPMYKTIFAN